MAHQDQHPESLANLKKQWLNSISVSSTTNLTITSDFIEHTLLTISKTDPIWTSNAILDFLSDQDRTQNSDINVSLLSVRSLIHLGTRITRVPDGGNVKEDQHAAQLLSMRYHLINYQRLLFAWEKIYSDDICQDTSGGSGSGNGDGGEAAADQHQDGNDDNDNEDEGDPWDEIQDEYSSSKSNTPSDHMKATSSFSEGQSQAQSSTSAATFPFSSLQPFLNSTPLQSLVSMIVSRDQYSTPPSPSSNIVRKVAIFLTNLHLQPKKELFLNRFHLIDLLVRVTCLNRIEVDLQGDENSQLTDLISERLLPSLNEAGEESSIWNLNSDVTFLNEKDIIDDLQVVQSLAELDLLEAPKQVEENEKQKANLLKFYKDEINSLQSDYGSDSLNICLSISEWVSSFAPLSLDNTHQESNRKLEKELSALTLLSPKGESDETNLERLRNEIKTSRGRIEILRRYLKQEEATGEEGSDLSDFFRLTKLVSELGEDQNRLSSQEKPSERGLDTNLIDFSSINSAPIAPSTQLFLQSILELIAPSSSLASNRPFTPSSSLSMSTQLLQFNHQNNLSPIPPSLEARLILSLLLGFHTSKDSEVQRDFQILNGMLMDLSRHNPFASSIQTQTKDVSTDVKSRNLVDFLKSFDSKDSNTLFLDLLSSVHSPLSISKVSEESDDIYFLSNLIQQIQASLNSFEVLSKWQNLSRNVGLPRSLSSIILSSLNRKEQIGFVRMLCRNAFPKELNIGLNSKVENWFDLLNDLLSLVKDHETRSVGFGLLDLMNGKEIVEIWLSGVVSTGDFELFKHIHQQLPGKITSELSLDDDKLARLILRSSREFYDSSDSLNLHRGGMKLAYDCLSIIPSNSIIKKEKAFIEATSKLSTFQLRSTIPNPSSSFAAPSKVTSKEIRSTSDRLVFIASLLSSRPEIYKSSEMVLDLGWKLSNTPVSKPSEEQLESDEKEELEVSVSKPLIEIRCLAMLIDSSIANEDLLEAYHLSQRLVDKIGEMRKRAQSMIKNQEEEINSNHSLKEWSARTQSTSALDLLPVVEEIGWKSCFQLVKHPGWAEEETENVKGVDDEDEDDDFQEAGETNNREDQEGNAIRARSSKDPDASKRLKLMSQVISLCPKNQLKPFLERWRSLDKEHFEISLQQDLSKSNDIGTGYSSRLNSKFLTDSIGKASDLSFISPFSSLFNSTNLSSQLSSLSGHNSNRTVATKPKANAPTGGFGKAAQLFDGFGDSSSNGNDNATSHSSPWDYANVASAERAARAARSFLGGFAGNSPVLGSASWSSTSPKDDSEKEKEKMGQGNNSNRNASGGFSLTRGMGWLMGEEER